MKTCLVKNDSNVTKHSVVKESLTTYWVEQVIILGGASNLLGGVHAMSTYNLMHGDCREQLKHLADNSIDSIVCDPPYELGFMGKKWDSTGIAYDVTVWTECLRVLKPGGHLIAFGGTRTYHRMTVAIEDAGFEIRDCIMWLYGSGFPKSHNVANAIDKSLGHGNRGHAIASGSKLHPTTGLPRANGEQLDKYKAKTELAMPYEGWGTALKPATENIIMAYKPHNTEHGIIIANLQKLEAQLWLMQYACSAEWSSTSSPSELSVVLSIAQWTAEEFISTKDDLLGQMDTLRLGEVMTTCLNIVQSWKNTWEEASNHGNTFITETVLSPIIGWTTLKSSLSHLTLNSIIKALMQHGTMWQRALSAELPFVVASQKLKSTLELIAVERAISRTSNPASTDNRTTVEPIVLARKPLIGTVADNVTTWGVGAINIDGCRVGEYGARNNGNTRGTVGSNSIGTYGKAIKQDYNMGRWPANVILDESAGEALDEQSGISKSAVSKKLHHQKTSNTDIQFNGKAFAMLGINQHDDIGGASRFFYTAKASKAEREAGLDRTCTVKYNIDRSILGGLSWNDVSTVVAQLLQKVTSELATLKWLIDESGASITVLYPSDSSFITSMETSRITALKICNSLMHSLTSESTADANCEMESGSSHAKSVEQLRAWILNTTNGKTELARGAVNVALITLQQISESEPSARNNSHSTVKPIALMRYLVRLVTPKGGTVLDPFMGSGSTGCASMCEGMHFVGIELNDEYIEIAKRRIEYWLTQSSKNTVQQSFDL